MLDLKFVAQNFQMVMERLKLRGGNLDLGPFQALMQQRRELYIALESLNQTRNTANERLKAKAKEGPSAIEALRDELRSLSQNIREKEGRLKRWRRSWKRFSSCFPICR